MKCVCVWGGGGDGGGCVWVAFSVMYYFIDLFVIVHCLCVCFWERYSFMS